MYLNDIEQLDGLNFDLVYNLSGLTFPTNFLTITGDDTNNPITGTDSDDVLNGEGGADFLDGGLGNDELHGGSGNDFLLGGEGDDMLFGGAGNDDLIGSVGNDRIYGGDGDDFISEGFFDQNVENDFDFIDAGNGNDLIVDLGGRDIVLAGSGDDEIEVSFFDNQNDFYNGGDGVDTVVYLSRDFTDFEITQDSRGVVFLTDETGARDTLHRVEFIQFNDITLDLSQPLPTVVQLGDGGETFTGSDLENDFIFGGAGNDIINGGQSDDRINGGAGDDQLDAGIGGTQSVDGGDGNDFITSSGVVDYLDGGAGDDTIISSSLIAIVTDDGGADFIDLSFTTLSFLLVFDSDDSNDFYIANGDASGGGDSQLIYFETSIFDVTFGEDATGNLTVTNELGGVDTITNFAGVRFIAETGEDITIDGTSGMPDIIYAQAGVDTVATHLDDLVLGTEGKDVITGAAGADRLYGYLGNDQIFGRTGDDSIFGGEGRDALNGGAGNDFLSGGAGNDLLIGQNGMDTLIDGAGDDILRGGNDDDTFVTTAIEFGNDFFSGGNGIDTVIYSGDFGQESFTFSLNNQGRLSVTDIFGYTDTFANVELIDIGGNLIDVGLLVSSLQGGNTMTLSDFEDFVFSDNTASDTLDASFLPDFDAIALELFAGVNVDIEIPDSDIWV